LSDLAIGSISTNNTINTNRAICAGSTVRTVNYCPIVPGIASSTVSSRYTRLSI
jgi:hypothetical protein